MRFAFKHKLAFVEIWNSYHKLKLFLCSIILYSIYFITSTYVLWLLDKILSGQTTKLIILIIYSALLILILFIWFTICLLLSIFTLLIYFIIVFLIDSLQNDFFFYLINSAWGFILLKSSYFPRFNMIYLGKQINTKT